MWVLFRVACPTPDGRTARDLFEKRIPWITEDMQASARQHGCCFHRAWYAQDGSAFYAVADWETREGAGAFFEEWHIEDEPGEVAIILEGDVGLVPSPQRTAGSIAAMLPDLPGDDDMRISTARLDLAPLTAADADDLFPVLHDPAIGRFTGETPPADVEAVRVGFARWEARRSPDGAELWLNWVLRRRDDDRAIGYVQATVGDADAMIAWTVGTAFQRQGFATEAGHALIAWLRDFLGIPVILGSIHPDNIPSQTAAHRIGLRPTDRLHEGEVVWEYIPAD